MNLDHGHVVNFSDDFFFCACEMQTNQTGQLSVNATSCLPARPQKAIAAAPVGAVPSHLATRLC